MTQDLIIKASEQNPLNQNDLRVIAPFRPTSDQTKYTSSQRFLLSPEIQNTALMVRDLFNKLGISKLLNLPTDQIKPRTPAEQIQHPLKRADFLIPIANAQMPGIQIPIPGVGQQPPKLPIPGVGQPPKPPLPGVDQVTQDLIDQIKKKQEADKQAQTEAQEQIQVQPEAKANPASVVEVPKPIPEFNLSNSAGTFGDPVSGQDYPWFIKKSPYPTGGIGKQPRQVLFVDGLPYDIFTFRPIPPAELGEMQVGKNNKHVMSVPSLTLKDGVFVDPSGKPFNTTNNGAPLLSTAIGYVPGLQSHMPSRQEQIEQKALGNKFYK